MTHAGGLIARGATDADRDAWDAFVAALPSADPLQAWAWGDVARTGGERPERLVVAAADGSLRGVVQVLVRDAVAGRRVLYAPHGPAWDAAAPDADAVLHALVEGLCGLGARQRGIVVKVDPRATARTPPGRIDAALRAHGLRRARADLQAPTTRVVDLRVGVDALFAGLEKDTRNLVRRSAREGVSSRAVKDPDPEAYRTFAALLAETGVRAGFRARPAAALEAIARSFASRGDACLVLAELDGRAIAGCLALATGPRAFYLYAGSLRDAGLRHANGPYAALWACIEALAAEGRETLDLWGVVETDRERGHASWVGFSLFKRGFGGVPLVHPGTYDLVIDRAWYAVRDLRERLRR